MATAARSLALVTGASTGIGFELAKCCAENGFDLVVAADEPEIQIAAQTFRDLGAMVLAVQADLSTREGIDRLWAELQGTGQPIEMLLAGVGQGIGGAFLDQDFNAVRHGLDTSLLGTLALLHRIGGDMRARGRGRILVAGAAPAASKAFLDSFSGTLRDELSENGVTVLCLIPEGAERMDPAEIAHRGFSALTSDEEPQAGWQTRLRDALAQVTH